MKRVTTLVLMKAFCIPVCLAVLATMAAPSRARGASADSARFLAAAQSGDAATIRALIAAGVDVNASAIDGTTALHWAAQRGDLDLVKLILAKGARADAANRYGVTPLRLACEEGSVGVAEALLNAGADAAATRAESGDTSLMIAARSGHADIVRVLIARGAPVDTVEPVRGQTALMWAADQRHPNVVSALLTAGAKTQLRSKTGLSALMFAVRAGDLDSTRLLLQHADVNAPAGDGTSMLVLAILNARFDVANLLLEHGADPGVNDPHGQPLHVLAFLRRSMSGNVSAGGNLPRQLPTSGVDSFALADALVRHGADINARYAANRGGAPRDMAVNSFQVGFDGATPFYIAAAHMDVPFMKFLAAHGADPTLPSATNVTPLIAASGMVAMPGAAPDDPAEALRAVTLAYELGNDPSAAIAPGGKGRMDPSYVGATALHGAAMIGASDLVKWLVDKGVPIDVKTARGATAYHYASATTGVGQFNAWPETADVILGIAKANGTRLDTAPLARK